ASSAALMLNRPPAANGPPIFRLLTVPFWDPFRAEPTRCERNASGSKSIGYRGAAILWTCESMHDGVGPLLNVARPQRTPGPEQVFCACAARAFCFPFS